MQEPETGDMLLDTWLMSCRVLGRQVEQAMINVVAEQAAQSGAKRLIGEYRPTKKNGMVKDHYAKLGFAPLQEREDGSTLRVCNLAAFQAAPTLITCREG